MHPNEIDAEILADFLARFVDWLGRYNYNVPASGPDLAKIISDFILFEDPQFDFIEGNE